MNILSARVLSRLNIDFTAIPDILYQVDSCPCNKPTE